MNKSRFYLIVILVLLLSNLFLVYMLINGPGKMRPNQGPKKLIVERLHFDANQVKAYDLLIEDHRQKISQFDEQMNLLRKELYAQLAAAINDEKRAQLLTELSQTQKEIEAIHFDHFLDIKDLCKPEQLAKFEELTKELMELFARKVPPPKGSLK